jgi:hypothetical protein
LEDTKEDEAFNGSATTRAHFFFPYKKDENKKKGGSICLGKYSMTKIKKGGRILC